MNNPIQRSKILLIFHYPPPMHGAAAVGGYIKQSNAINQAFNTQYINLSTSVSIHDIGKNNFSKWFRYANIVLSTFSKGLFWRPQLTYITLTTHGLGLWKDAVIVAVCRLFRLKHVFHLHNKGVVLYKQHTLYADRLYRFVFKKAKVILLSPLLYEDISTYVNPKNVFYCGNGIPDFSEGTITNTQEIKTKVHVLFLSNLIASKGIWDVLEACQILNHKGIYFNCSIVGGEGDIHIEELESQIRVRGLQESVHYLGKKYGNEKTAIFQSADIFALPTYYNNECFPLVLLEAMQFALPVVSTNEGAIPEIVDNGITGFIVPKRNPQALADKLALLIEDADLRIQMGQAGRKKYESAYTLEHFESRFCEILHEITSTQKIEN